MPYQYGIKNTFRPTALIPNAYGWSTRPQYQRADVPTGMFIRDQVPDPSVLLQQFAYEWFKSGELNDNANLANPPFISGAAGRLHPSLRDTTTGLPARILRGFIRRADKEAGNEMSKARLYFMYNPESITRDYVSYLNQSALDPFNTVFESGNLVAPPSFMDFSFSLFFDRQEEATDATHPGVFVDYQFFDLVVRNVIPSAPGYETVGTMPDNGVMMVNPRDITVVFSPQLTVQGRPLNAKVNFERFTHRMVPTRMTISLTIRVVYMGPMRDQVEYTKEKLQAEAAIPLNEMKPEVFPFSMLQHEEDSQKWWEKLGTGLLKSTVPGVGAIWGLPDVVGGVAGGVGAGLNTAQGLINDMMGTATDANVRARAAALTWAQSVVIPGGIGFPGMNPWTDYVDKNSGSRRWNLPDSADCSGLVTEAYNKIGLGQALNWTSHPGTGTIISQAKADKARFEIKELDSLPWQWKSFLPPEQQTLLYGDILIRDGHIVFVIGYERPSGNVSIFDAASQTSIPEVGKHVFRKGSHKWYRLRPTPIGSTSSGAMASVWNGPR